MTAATFMTIKTEPLKRELDM